LVDFGAFKGSDETHQGFVEESEHEEEEEQEEEQEQQQQQHQQEEEPLSTNEVAAKSFIRRGEAQSWPPGAKKKRIICRVKRKSAKGQPIHLHPKVVQETNFQREQDATVPASRPVQGRANAGAPRRKRRKRRVQIFVGS